MRFVNQAGREREPLFPATRKRAGELFAACDHAETFEAFFDGGLTLRNLIQPRDEIQVFLDAQIFVERKSLRHVADVFFDLGALCAEIVAEAAAFTAVGLEQTAEHPQEGRLAAAVRAEETVNLAGSHLHGDMVDDGARAKFFRDVAHVNDEIGSAHKQTFDKTGQAMTTGFARTFPSPRPSPPRRGRIVPSLMANSAQASAERAFKLPDVNNGCSLSRRERVRVRGRRLILATLTISHPPAGRDEAPVHPPEKISPQS